MTRTTIDLDPAVLRLLRERSRRSGRPMGTIASEALAHALAQMAKAAPATFTWIARDLGASRVDLEDKEAVRALLERR